MAPNSMNSLMSSLFRWFITNKHCADIPLYCYDSSQHQLINQILHNRLIIDGQKEVAGELGDGESCDEVGGEEKHEYS